MNTAQELNNGMTMCFVGKFGSYGHGWNPLQNSRPIPQNQNLMITTALALFDLYHRLCNLTLLEVIAMNGGPYSSSVIANKMPLGYMSLYLHDDNLLFWTKLGNNEFTLSASVS